jgi:hypothetical protein
MRRHVYHLAFFCLAALLGPLKPAFGQQTPPEASGMAFLKLSGSAEITGLGDDHVAGILSPADIRLNPAVAALLPSTQAQFDYGLLPTEGNTDLFCATSRSQSGIAVALTAYIIREGTIEVRTAPTIDPLYTSIPQNFSLGATFAARIFDSLTAGVTLKWLNEKITVYNADGFGLDIGLHYTFSSEYEAGLAFQDIGSMSKLLNEASSLPTRATLTVAGSPNWLSSGMFRTKILLTHQQSLTDNTNHSSFGIAENYNQVLELRLGYVTNNQVRGISFGAGINYEFLSINYSFAPPLNGFNSTNLFGLNVRF